LKSQTQTLQEIRQYLLGALSQEQAAEIEERLLSDGELYEELLIAEDELVDQYLSGELSARERERVESHFLRAPERQEQLRFGHLLSRYVSAHRPEVAAEAEAKLPPVVVTSKRASFLSRLLPPSPALAFSLGCALLVLLVGGFWAVNRILQPTSGPGTVWAIELTPGLTRDGGDTRKFAVPANTGTVRLQLDLAEDQYQSYEAILQDAEGRTLTTTKGLKAQPANARTAVLLDVKPNVMPAGDYRVKLGGLSLKGEAESVANYSFRVLPN
jgi:anti-sigma factor RsiW